MSVIRYTLTGQILDEPTRKMLVVLNLLKADDELSTIRRPELWAEQERVVTELLAEVRQDDGDMRNQLMLAKVVVALNSAYRAARAYRRNPLTRVFSHLRFAVATGKAAGGLCYVLERLGAIELPEDESRRD